MTPSAPTRFAHLIYTSFDDGSGSGGGWQVKDVSGDLDPAERDALTAWVSTRFDLQPVLERYPTPEAIEGRERRLMYAAVPGGAAYWHIAEAGTDGSGRPGNIFAHVVLDRAIDDPIPAFRPIQLWLSPSWSMPYGPAATRSAVVSSTSLPEPGSAITREKVLAFLTDVRVFRLGVLQVLLDAVAHAWEGGPPVVLLTENSESGTLWIGAVSFFMSPATSRRFNWSTHDRAGAVVENIGRRVHLTVAPDSEKESLQALSGIVVLDSQDDPILGVLDGVPHRTHHGVSVEVTPWSMLAQASLSDYATALSVVELQDAIAEEAGGEGLSPMWPLAIAVLSFPSLEDVKREASRVVSEHRPGSLLPESRLAEVSDEIDAEFAPQSAVEAMAALIRSKSHGRNTTGALSSLIRLAVRDDEWMSLHPAGEIGAEFAGLAPSVFSTDISALLGELSGLACDRFAKKADLTVRLLRIADVLVATNADAAVSFDLVEQLCQVFENVAAELMDPAAGPRIVATVGRRLDERTLRLVVRRTLATMPRLREVRFGHRFSVEVIRWVAPSKLDVPALCQIADEKNQLEYPYDVALFLEYVYSTLMLDWASPPERAHVREYAGLAVWGILDDQRERADPSDRSEDLRALCRLNALSPSDVGALFKTFGEFVPPEAARQVVLYAEDTAHLATVLAHLIAAGHRPKLDGRRVKSDQVTIAWGALRGLADWGDLTRSAVVNFIDTYFDPIMNDYNELFGRSIAASELAQDLSQKLGLLFYVAQSMGHDVSAYTAECRSHLIATAESQSGQLRALMARSVVDVSRMAGKSFIDFVEQRYQRPSARPSREDEFLSELVRKQLYSGPSDSDSLRDAMWPLVRDMAAHDAERIFANYPRCVGEWLEAHGIRRYISDIRPSEDRGAQW
ncbi:hypothetical protein [Rhodococcus sp. H29-C3]|uniref:GAP1-N2 domain-containing protein n=1 Tax=Rhodococcus sp. H29-C3 TaxID=3046307 RepID=UPI0024B9FCD0|nr:hypothetical protein [Rhodococcus sp. H29-C3]MDJ0362437.1 hypothetical protein [Rhodococcus sp. H29-C3]